MAKWSEVQAILDTFQTPTPLTMVKEFAIAMGQPIGIKHPALEDASTKQSIEAMELRQDLIGEEFREVNKAIDSEPDAAILKELADLVYVVYGYAATFGWDLDEAVKRVHQSNMSKLGDDGKPLYREDGKVLKSSNYKAPNLEDLV